MFIVHVYLNFIAFTFYYFILFLQPLNDENWNGENILFKVEIFANDSLIESKETEEAFVSFKTSDTFQLAILVWSKNEMGLSQQHSRLLVGKGGINNSYMNKL